MRNMTFLFSVVFLFSCGSQEKSEIKPENKKEDDSETKKEAVAENWSVQHPCAFTIEMPEKFKTEKMYEDESPDYCDYYLKCDDPEIFITVNSLVKSRFESTDAGELYRMAIENAENPIIDTVLGEGWFILVQQSDAKSPKLFWKRSVGENFISDLRINIPEKKITYLDFQRMLDSFTSD